MFFAILKNKKLLIGLIMTIIIIILAIAANIIAPYQYDESNVGSKLQTPNLHYLFGTDHLGRDVFSRVVYGTRVSLVVALMVAFLALIIGIFLGVIAGYYSNSIADHFIMRSIDILYSIPWILTGLVLAVLMKPGVNTVIIALTIVYIPTMTRVVRSSVLGVKELDFITAARITGENNFSIILRYIIPNSFGPIIIQFMFVMSYAVLGEAALSYLGYGVKPPTPSWGLLLQNSINYAWTSPYLFIFPGIVIIFSVLSFNFLGDGLRDIIDPRYRRTFLG